MADHFADRYWATRFWTARYFQGGAVDPNAMEAVMSGSSSMSATVTTGGIEDILGSGIMWRPKKRKKVAEFDIAADDDFVLTQVIEHLSRAA
jgi:hypothetical protein